MGNDDFIATYGDGVSDVNIDKLINFHKRHKGVVTLTAVSHQSDLVKSKYQLIIKFLISKKTTSLTKLD